MALTVPKKYQKVGAAALVLIFALIFFLKLPQSQLNYGRQLEYQAVYETYEKTHVLLARPGSDANFPDPKAIPQDHKNLGRGGVLDDPGIYLLPFVTVPFHIHNPLTGMHWVMIVLGVLTLLQLLIKFLSGSRRYKKSFFILLLIPGILESLNIVPLASSWGATPSNYSLTGELALLVLLNIWLFSKSKRFIGSVGSLALTVVCLYVLVLVRRSAGLEISLVGLFLTFFLTRDQPPLDKKESNPNKWKIRKSNVLQFWPMVAFLAVVFLATSLATQTVSLARSASAQHLTYKEGESNHSFWGVIYTGLGWRPINNGSAECSWCRLE